MLAEALDLNGNPETVLSSLLTWMRTPGNELYIGTSWTLDEGLTEQMLFAKFTHLWRL